MASPTTAASFKVAATTIAEVASASFSLTRQSIDVTPLGNTHRHHEPGIIEGTATIELFYNSTDHATMMANFESGAVLNEAEIVWESGKSVKGKALIQDWSMTLAPNGVAQATITLIFTQNAMTITE
jgi:hypothetical protein